MPRYFVPITEEELKEKVEKELDNHDEIEYVEDRVDYLNILTKQIEKDLSKCQFDTENVASEGCKNFGPIELLGYNTLDNGLSYLGVCAGGDWEVPVFFIIYWDGKKLRGYIPKDGNPWNTDTKFAYGNYYEVDDELADGKNLKKRPNLLKSYYACHTSDWSIQHWCEADVDWKVDLIKQDIIKRIKCAVNFDKS